jgi:hypothetical protein
MHCGCVFLNQENSNRAGRHFEDSLQIYTNSYTNESRSGSGTGVDDIRFEFTRIMY